MSARRFAGPLLLIAIVVAFFGPSLFGDRAELPCNPNRWDPWRIAATPEEIAPPAVNTDCALAYYPRRAFATDRMRAGDLPLWDPYTFCGQPFLANYQSALLYPVNLALYLMEPLRAMGWFVAVHFILGGFFTIELLRTLGSSRGAAIVGGIAYGISPYFMTRIGHPTFVSTAAWIPLVLAFVFRLRDRPSLRNGAFLGGAFALAALAGFPQTLVHLHYAAALAALALLPAMSGGRARFLALYAGAVLLSFGLAAFQLFPTYEFLRESTRAAMDWPTFLSGTHHPAMIWRAWFPDLFGNPMDENLWSTLFTRGNGYFRQNYVSTLGYCGIATLALGVPGLLFARGRGYWIALLALSLAILWGTPVARLFHALPGFAFSRPDRIIVLVNLALAVGLASALDAWKEERMARMGASLLFAGAGSCALVFLLAKGTVFGALAGGRVPLDVADVTFSRTVVTTLALSLSGLAAALFVKGSAARIALVGLLVTVDLFLFGSRFHLTLPYDATFRETNEIRSMQSEVASARLLRVGGESAHLLPPGTASLYGMRDIAGINALNLDRYRTLLEAVQPGVYDRRRYTPFREENARSPVLAMLAGVPYSIAQGRPARLPPEAGAARPSRALLVYDWETVSEERMPALLTDPSFDPSKKVLLESAIAPPPLAPGRGTADIRIDDPDLVVIDASTDSGAVLFLADTHYPGWEVSVNDTPAALLRANYAFRAVPLSAGEHVVKFEFRPRSFRTGAVVAALSWALAACLVLAVRRRSA
ncbi:MAG: YfhO family protein [Gemmatimonadetes bacterium]|nr:YfhO family protein [Gemmatimonadota bacterium]